MKSNFSVKEAVLISGANPKKCISCGKCTASCPSSMPLPPHKIVKYAAQDTLPAFEKGNNPYDNDRLRGVDSLLQCLSCFACTERCPRGVEPAALIEALRVQMLRPQGENYFYADDVTEWLDLDEDMPQQLLVSVFRKYRK